MRNRIRKLEREAVAANPSLQGQIDELNAKREALYVAAKPQLKERYEAEKALQAQINQMVSNAK